MHIPDGFIPWTQCAIYYVILIVALYFATKWAKKNLDDKHVPLMAILAAGIFAIMSMNMPIPVLVFTIVLLIQALIYGDGGLTALGTNVLNMGIIGGCVGLYTFKGLKNTIGKYPAVGVAAWLATVVAAAAAAVELAIAGTFPLTLGIYSMVLYHVFIGIIEAVLTVIVIMALEKYRPDLLMWNKQSQGGK